MITLIDQQRETGTGLSLAAMCRVLEVPRAAYYRGGQGPVAGNETALRDAIQRIALEMPAYGSRRIAAQLRRQGWVINRKRVQRIMREDNLLCLRRKKFVRTTDSEHGLAVYPNLAPTLDVTGLNQLWVADITYIRLPREFVYLAALYWLVAGTQPGGGVTPGGLADGLGSARGGARTGAPLRPRRAVRLGRLHRSAPTAQHRYQHEPQGQSLRQRPGGIVHEDLEIRGGLLVRV